MMKIQQHVNKRGGAVLVVMFLFLILTVPAQGDHTEEAEEDDNDKQQDPSFTERAIGITGLNSRWDTLRAWAKLAWMNIRPPDASYGQGSDTGGNAMTNAAAKSFETSKETVEQAAASAAKAAGEATERLKRSMSTDDQNSDEL